MHHQLESKEEETAMACFKELPQHLLRKMKVSG
jgi:hypothetical protein